MILRLRIRRKNQITAWFQVQAVIRLVALDHGRMGAIRLHLARLIQAEETITKSRIRWQVYFVVHNHFDLRNQFTMAIRLDVEVRLLVFFVVVADVLVGDEGNFL